jgi:demethylmenaquinone methyltransferase/2-methoxy-6-polyprenyl-1,4-benzoquinol methylase
LYRLRKKNRQIRDMFSSISGRYDLLNRLLSFGQDVMWRREAVKKIRMREGGIHLDLACGTADMGIELVAHIKGADVIGADISHRMLEEGRRKVEGKNLGGQFRFVVCAGESLPFKDEVFDSILIAFGIRNVVERELALWEMARVLKKEGVLVILEFSLPRSSLMRKVYLFYFRTLLPRLAGIFSDRSAYEYLTESVLDFPDPEEFKHMMARSGFAGVSAKAMNTGIVTIFTGKAI